MLRSAADEPPDPSPSHLEDPVSRNKANLAQRQADHRTWALLGLVILVLLGFVFTVQTLWVSIVRSGFLGDNLPANGWMLLVALVGLTALFCLSIVHQPTKIHHFRARRLTPRLAVG